MPDRDDLSQFLGRKPYRRRRTSTGADAGMPRDLEIPRERVYCMNERRFIRYKDLYTVWEFGPGRAFRMRFCKWCDTMVAEKEFNLGGDAWQHATDAVTTIFPLDP